jgi:hypothetical protein
MTGHITMPDKNSRTCSISIDISGKEHHAINDPTKIWL